MAKKYADLIVSIAIEIVEWLKTRRHDRRKNNESKGNSETKRQG